MWGESRIWLNEWLTRQAYLGLRVNHLGDRWANDRRAIIESLGTPDESYHRHRWFESVSRLDLLAGGNLTSSLEIRVEVINLTNNLTPEVPEVVVPGRRTKLTLSTTF